MATPGELYKFIAAELGVKFHTAEKIWDRLREFGLVKKGTRGRYGVEVGAKEAALFLVAVSISARIVDIPDMISAFAKAVSADGHILFDDLESMLEDNPTSLRNVSCVEFCVPSITAKIGGVEYQGMPFLPDSSDKQRDRRPVKSASLDICARFPGSVLSNVAEFLQEY